MIVRYDIDSPIIAGRSLAGLSLEMSLEDLASLLDRRIPFVRNKYCLFDQQYEQFIIDGGGVTATADASRHVKVLSCRTGYKGMYRSQFFPGMTVGQVLKKSTRQLVIHSSLVVDDDYGACFDVPEFHNGQFYDDIDFIHQLPSDMILPSLSVRNPEWWWQAV